MKDNIQSVNVLHKGFHSIAGIDRIMMDTAVLRNFIMNRAISEMHVEEAQVFISFTRFDAYFLLLVLRKDISQGHIARTKSENASSLFV